MKTFEEVEPAARVGVNLSVAPEHKEFLGTLKKHGDKGRFVRFLFDNSIEFKKFMKEEKK